MVPENGPDQETIVPVADGPPSETVLQAVAEAEGTDPMGLSPLYEAVDPDALDAMFDGRTSGSLMFDYQGYLITINENDVVSVRK